MPHHTKSKHGKGKVQRQYPEGTVRGHGRKRGTVRGPRKAMPWLPNVAGTRFVRDASKPGCEPKRITR